MSTSTKIWLSLVGVLAIIMGLNTAMSWILDGFTNETSLYLLWTFVLTSAARIEILEDKADNHMHTVGDVRIPRDKTGMR